MLLQKTRVRTSSLTADISLTIGVAAVDRVHRIGQEKTVYVKHFIVSTPALFTLLFKR